MQLQAQDPGIEPPPPEAGHVPDVADHIRIPGFGIDPPRTGLADAALACGFSPETYLDANPDLREIGLTDAFDAVCHDVSRGGAEKRVCPAPVNWSGVRRLREQPGQDATEVATLVEPTAVANAVRWNDPLREWRREHSDVLEQARLIGGRPILVFGDSHAIIYVARKEMRGGDCFPPVDLRSIDAFVLRDIPSVRLGSR